MRILSFSAAMLCLALPFAGLPAQQTPPTEDHATRPGRLGLLLDGRPDRADTLGALIRDVVPDGPADKAGLLRGDVLTRFNGTPLDGTRKLTELARPLQPGDTVRLEYKRDGKSAAATIVAADMGPRHAMMLHQMPGMPGFGPGGDRDHRMFLFRRGSPVGLQLVQMSRDLGEYFGTTEGLLVVRPPADSASPLRAGDVILAIDGRKPESVPHALRILASYAPGEKAKLEVIRKKQKTTLSWTAPERHRERHGEGHGDGEGWRSMGLDEGMDGWNGFDFDMPELPALPLLGYDET